MIFAGRLGGYKYYDMDKAIAAAFELVRNELSVEPTEAKERGHSANHPEQTGAPAQFIRYCAGSPS